jgi:hypothetical protein
VVTPGHDPEKGIRDVVAIPISGSVAPPRVVDLGGDGASLAFGVVYVLEVEDLFLGVAMEEVYVDEVCLGEIGEVRVPCEM